MPTQIQRVWLSIEDPLTQTDIAPRGIEEQTLRGNRKIGARSYERYDLSFKAVFDGAPQQDWRQRVVLRVKAIGLPERRRLDERLWLASGVGTNTP